MFKQYKSKTRSLLVKIYGLYEIRVANRDVSYHIVMENLFIDVPVDQNYIKLYDLKGSETNRLADRGGV